MIVAVESPYRPEPGLTEPTREHLRRANEAFARRCVRDSLLRGESPIASHLLYTQAGILDDDVPEEREQGIRAHLEIVRRVDLVAVYDGRGVSEGMQRALDLARELGVPIEWRSLEGVRS